MSPQEIQLKQKIIELKEREILLREREQTVRESLLTLAEDEACTYEQVKLDPVKLQAGSQTAGSSPGKPATDNRRDRSQPPVIPRLLISLALSVMVGAVNREDGLSGGLTVLSTFVIVWFACGFIYRWLKEKKLSVRGSAPSS